MSESVVKVGLGSNSSSPSGGSFKIHVSGLKALRNLLNSNPAWLQGAFLWWHLLNMEWNPLSHYSFCPEMHATKYHHISGQVGYAVVNKCSPNRSGFI